MKVQGKLLGRGGRYGNLGGAILLNAERKVGMTLFHTLVLSDFLQISVMKNGTPP